EAASVADGDNECHRGQLPHAGDLRKRLHFGIFVFGDSFDVARKLTNLVVELPDVRQEWEQCLANRPRNVGACVPGERLGPGWPADAAHLTSPFLEWRRSG